MKKQEARAELATTSSLSAYVATLPQDQLQLLTRDMSPEVKEAMQMVIKYIFKVSGGGAARALARGGASHQTCEEDCTAISVSLRTTRLAHARLQGVITEGRWIGCGGAVSSSWSGRPVTSHTSGFLRNARMHLQSNPPKPPPLSVFLLLLYRCQATTMRVSATWLRTTKSRLSRTK